MATGPIHLKIRVRPIPHLKIRVKGGPKVYKSGRPGLSGQARLERRVSALLVAANRLARKGPPSADTAYAGRLVAVLQLFVAAPPAMNP